MQHDSNFKLHQGWDMVRVYIVVSNLKLHLKEIYILQSTVRIKCTYPRAFLNSSIARVPPSLLLIKHVFVFIDTITYIVLTLKTVSLSLNFNGQNYGRTITKHPRYLWMCWYFGLSGLCLILSFQSNNWLVSGTFNTYTDNKNTVVCYNKTPCLSPEVTFL